MGDELWTAIRQCFRAPRSSGIPAETSVRPSLGPRVILGGGSVCTLLRSGPLLRGRRSFLQTREGQSQNIFPCVTRVVEEWGEVRACPPVDDEESRTWHRLSNCGRT